ncbi:gamma-aminobutyric acid type B receptor subunit 1-like [Halichondria panicea]|uniref:gamma-aminobutyric acid type B receptor subunit 1-like n=1 Tax=Halichondria panicea TaxID=6063 RepID=UPI00312BAAED
MAIVQVLVASILLASNALAAAGSKNQTLYILTLLPYPYINPLFDPSWSEGPQVSLALEIAKEDINNQNAILPGYQIELIGGDCGCEYVDRAYEAIGSTAYYPGVSKMPIGIIGPGCSSSSLSVSSLTNREALSFVTVHGGGSPLLSDRINLPYSLGTLGSAEAFANVTIELMRANNWHRIGILFNEFRQFYSSTAQSLHDIISSNSTLSSYLSPVYDSTYIPLSEIIQQGIRINILFTPVRTTRQVLCLALHRGVVYPAYQWIVTSNTFEDIAQNVNFVFNNQVYNCSETEMRQTALNRVSFINYRLSHINESAPSTYSKRSFKEYDALFRNRLQEHNLQNNANITYSVWTTYFYDTLWAWAVVLDRVAIREPNMDLTQFRYGNTSLSKLVLEEFYGLDFEGVSGRIKFNNDSGFLNRVISVFQAKDGNVTEIAYFDGVHFIVKEDLDAIEGEFPDKNFNIGPGVFAALFIVTVLELVILITLHVLTIKYRFSQSVKASSPKLSLLTFIGCYLIIFTLFLYMFRSYLLLDDYTTVFLCNLTWAWLLPISFTLAYGTVAVRTWRLHRIFTHYLNPGRFIADHYLMAFVFILLGVDVLFGTLWMAIDPQQLAVKNVTQDVTNFVVRTCRDNSYWSYALVFGYRGVLIVIVLVLAFLTRNIQNQSFRTKTLRVLVYLSSLTLAVGFVLFYLFLFYGPPLSHGPTVFLNLTFHGVLLLFITLICLPPLIPKLREEFYKKFPHLIKTREVDFEIETDSESCVMEGSSRFYI